MSEDGQGEGASDNGWKESLPESIRDWDEVSQSETPDAFWDQMTNMRSRMGRSLTIPGQDAGEEDRKAFYEKVQNKVPELMLRPTADDPEQMNQVYRMMGMPEKATDYTLPEMELGDLELQEDRIEAYRGIAHEAGLGQEQFSKVLSAVTALDVATETAARQAHTEEINALNTEWGAAAEQNKNLAETVRAQYFPFIPEQMNANTMKAFVNIAQQLGGESKSLLETHQASGIMTPEDAAMQLSEIMGNPKHPYWDPKDIGHKAARAKVSKLTRLKLGSQ